MDDNDVAEFRHLSDFEYIKDFIDRDPKGFQVPFNQPPFVPDFGVAIIIGNTPIVTEDKCEKLRSVINKLIEKGLNQEGAEYIVVPIEDIWLPIDPQTNLTAGFCFAKFSCQEHAEKVVSVTQGFELGKKNILKLAMYTDFEKYAAYSEDYVPPQTAEFHPLPDPTTWLTDPLGRDQFVIRYGDETEILWANTNQGEEPALVYGGEREKKGGKKWTELYVQWSPQGTYLATFHAQGIKLWGGATFEAHGRFNHPSVEELEFSPCENYLVTSTYDISQIRNPEEAIIVWNVRDGSKLRTFSLKNPLDIKFQVSATITEEKGGKKFERVIRGRVSEYHPGYNTFAIMEGNVKHDNVYFEKIEALQKPNNLKWSPDGKYVARLGCDNIPVYELPSMGLLDKKSIAAKDVLDFQWSPKGNMISYWSPASGNLPAFIFILQLPARNDICSRKVFDVLDGCMVWQSEGDYLCVYMTRVQGKKKNFVLMFFRVREPGVPVEQLDLSDPIIHMSWEPTGERFVVVHGEARSPSVSFYSMSGKGDKKDKKEIVSLFSIVGKPCNNILWSPAGGVVAIAHFAPDYCVFDLHDVDSNVCLSTRRHDRANRLVWDPSGRMIASCTLTALRGYVSRNQSDDGFNVYSFQGGILTQVRRERLHQFQWRPRPKDILTAEDKKRIIKNLRKYEKVFEKEDSLRREQLDSEVVASRKRQAEEFFAILRERQRVHASYRSQLIALRDGYDSDDDNNYEIGIQVEETVMNSKDQVIH